MKDCILSVVLPTVSEKEPMSIMMGIRWQSGRHRIGAVAKNSHPNHRLEAERELTRNEADL